MDDIASPPRTLRREVLVGAASLVAGLCGAHAMTTRWAPCALSTSSQQPGAVAFVDACTTAQDESRDGLLPNESNVDWVQLPGVSEALAAEHLLLALALAVAGAAAGRGARRWSFPAAAVLAVAGVATLLSAVTGEALPVNTIIAPLVSLVGPVVLVGATVVLLRSADGPVARLVAVVPAAVGLTTPLADYALMLPFSFSHDTPSWSGLPRVAVTLALGAAILLGSAVAARRR